MIYFRDGTTRGNQFPHFAVDRCGLQVGDTIDSPVTPLAWPRADGSLPEPPAVPIGDLHANIRHVGMFPEASQKN